ncbi:acetyl-coenzyme A synthetase 2-like, mitochondrial [Mercenaria mercenaria]|uniref:acetyl-coenzyme A synthetase 2-like, mitochondrial n=1 Tax=Mercenaria mercenaria TaxID=6596 RepID=UPI00234F2A34|nr:acetyl-coenzyme A synthetase 2-like, mitochondrial [Mercenaria mercenaria]
MKRLILSLPSVLGRGASKLKLRNNANTTTSLQGGREFSDEAVDHSTTPFPEFDSFKTHDELYQFSLNSPEFFWGTLARSRLKWFRDFGQVKDCDLIRGHIRWFLDGQLNVAVNCVDRHAEKNPDSIALIWEKDEPGTQEYVSYRELLQLVCRMSNVLESHGVKRGDRVAIYLPQSPVAVAAMLACARIGAIHNVVFAGFSAEALAGRIIDAQAETVITADQGVRGGKIIELKHVVDEAVQTCPCVKRVFVYQRTGADVPMGKLDINLDKELASQPDTHTPAVLDSEDYLFMLYTSGSTGKPKGIAHTQAGYLLYAGLTMKHVFDYQDKELFGCVADIGWITGHSYVVYGPLSNGAATLLFESTPVYPNPGRYWETVERLKLNHLYLAPTALRMLLKSGNSWVTRYDRSSLRKLGCVGEPLNREAWEWFYEVIGEKRCDICDTWWQTETGGIAITPRPSAPGAEIRPAMPMRPFFGIEPVLMEPQMGTELKGGNVKGALCIKRPWPGMARTIYGDHQRFIDTYYKTYHGLYFTGDGAYRTQDGYYQITGRMDDVLNVSGHRLGTAEIEDVIDDLEETAESAVVGFPHEIKGWGIYAFVVLKDEVNTPENEMKEQLKAMVKQRISGFAQPDVIMFAPGLPKTRSGKIMRRILRKIAANQPEELGDVSTLFDPGVVDALAEKHNQITKKS